MVMYLLLSAGCAECRSGPEPLMEAFGPFDTREEAQAASWLVEADWEEHPQGGWFARSSQGDDWVLPVPEGTGLTEWQTV